MKITRRQLRRMILKEFSYLNESPAFLTPPSPELQAVINYHEALVKHASKSPQPTIDQLLSEMDPNNMSISELTKHMIVDPKNIPSKQD